MYTLESRWKQKIKELRHKTTPLAYALRKYHPDKWTHKVLLETESLQEATDYEIEMISKIGYYNLAKGGTGGNTGRNHEPAKIKKQAKSLSKHWKSLPEEEKQRRINANVEAKRRNGTLGFKFHQTKEKHGNWDGYWYIFNKRYTTLLEAANAINADQSTIIDLCIRKVDKIWARDTKYVSKGNTPRDMGHYKEKYEK
jgi:hypothetical protein